MSSPLSSLDKSKKSSSNPSKSFGKRSMPFRSSEYIREQELLDDVTTHMVCNASTSKTGSLPEDASTNTSSNAASDGVTPRRLLNSINSRFSPILNPVGKSRISSSSKEPLSSDMELIAIMMKRITQLEKQTAFYSRELLEKDKKIKILEEKNTLLSKAKEYDRLEIPSKLKELETECYQLQQQLYEMEAFLADYGMIWIGEKLDSSDEMVNEQKDNNLPVAHISNWSSHPGLANCDENIFKVDYDLILKNVKDLNVIAGEGVSAIEKTKDGARLKLPESIPLVLYANGIMMFNGPFRPFSEISTQRCLGDIMDGFFPSELHGNYPDGIPLQVTDKRHVVYKDPRKQIMFPGVGRTLQDESVKKLPLHDSATEQLSKYTSTDETSNKQKDEVTNKLTVDQFLEKLPANVIRDGKVISIRKSLKNVLSNDVNKQEAISSSAEIVDTQAVHEMRERMNMPENARPLSARDVTTIRVKCEDGLKTYILKMKFLDTIGDLRRYINKQRPRHQSAYEIISTFPRQIHSDTKKTLQESGLIPNATLHLKPQK